MTVITQVQDAVQPWLGEYRALHPGADRFASTVQDPDRQFVLEAVYEGYLMHYGEPRAFTGMDPDLRLLAGDSLYALGVARLAEREDLEAVAELSDLISLTARAHAEDAPDKATALWLATALALSGRGGKGAAASWRDDV